MCEALPPTLEKNNMNLGGYMSIYGYIFLFVFLASIKTHAYAETWRTIRVLLNFVSWY